MVIWKGYGILVLVIAVIIGAIISLAFEAMGSTRDMGAAIGTFVSGAVIWFVGKKLNDPAKGRTIIDKKSGQEFTLLPDHSLFFIKMQYWAFIIAGFGIIMLISMLLKGSANF